MNACVYVRVCVRAPANSWHDILLYGVKMECSPCIHTQALEYNHSCLHTCTSVYTHVSAWRHSTNHRHTLSHTHTQPDTHSTLRGSRMSTNKSISTLTKTFTHNRYSMAATMPNTQHTRTHVSVSGAERHDTDSCERRRGRLLLVLEARMDALLRFCWARSGEDARGRETPWCVLRRCRWRRGELLRLSFSFSLPLSANKGEQQPNVKAWGRAVAAVVSNLLPLFASRKSNSDGEKKGWGELLQLWFLFAAAICKKRQEFYRPRNKTAGQRCVFCFHSCRCR